MRSLLLDEIGSYVESESILTTSEVGDKFSQDFVENISTITAGITKFKILEETWNGYPLNKNLKIIPVSQSI